MYFLCAVSLRALLEFSYVNFISIDFAYAGFIIDFHYLNYVESWFLWITLVSLFPKRLDKPSDFLLVYFLFSFLTPLLIFYGLTNQEREFLYIVLLGVFLIIIFRMGKPFKLPTVKKGRFIALSIIATGVFFVTGWTFLSGAVQYINFNLTKVYEFRAETGSLLNQGLMSYINIWSTKVLGLLLLLHCGKAILLRWGLLVFIFSGVMSHRNTFILF